MFIPPSQRHIGTLVGILHGIRNAEAFMRPKMYTDSSTGKEEIGEMVSSLRDEVPQECYNGIACRRDMTNTPSGYDYFVTKNDLGRERFHIIIAY